MSISDFENDQQFQRMIGAFLHGMITQHGFTFEEAYSVVHGKIKREYDQHKRTKSKLQTGRNVVRGPTENKGISR